MREIKLTFLDKVVKWYLSYKKLDTVLRFGKYRGRAVIIIINIDAQYIEWCLSKKILG